MLSFGPFWILVFLVIFLHQPVQVMAYNNGYGLKPFLGWQSWCAVGKCGTDACYDRQIRSTAKAMVDNGMKALGFEWVVIDDCWHPSRDSNGTLIPYAPYFPNGIKPVVDYVHSLGLKFGLYTSVGTLTCHGGWSPGSFGHYQQDADLFARWEVDYVKVDWCGANKTMNGHINISHALNQTGRPMVLELCRGTYEKLDNWGYASTIAQVWRANGDHHDSFSHTLEQLAAIKGKSNWSAPYGWAYMDMMMIGGEGCKDNPNPDKPQHCPQQTDHEYRTECALYSISASPMMIGTDIRNMTKVMNECLLNPEIIAINQDYLAKPGFQTKSCGDDAWVRKLSDGTFAVVVPNLGDKTDAVNICFADIGWPNITALVHDVWSQADIGISTNQWGAKIKSHDTLYVILKSAPPPVGCTVTCTTQISKRECLYGKTYGCFNETQSMWVAGGCRGTFTCDGVQNVNCSSSGEKNTTCPCSKPASATIQWEQ